jgi:hypothetical protein
MEIFVSHSSKDADIAAAIVEMLRAALNIPSVEIRCTSVNGYRLETGISTDEQLRQEIHEAKVLIGLITSESLKSYYVLFELGARWGAGNFLAPVLAGVNSRDLPGPLTGRNAINCSDPGQIHQLVDDIAKQLGRVTDKYSSYAKYIDQLSKLSKRRSKPLRETNKSLKKVASLEQSNTTKTQQIPVDSGHRLPVNNISRLEVITEFKKVREYNDLIQYNLAITVLNKEGGKAEDYRIEVEFPRAFLNEMSIYAVEVPERRTQTHRFFRITNRHHMKHVLYAGDSIPMFSIDYSVNAEIARTDAMKETLRIAAYLGDDIVRQVVRPMTEVAEFLGK